MMSPLLEQQLVELIHAERTRMPRQGRPVVARTVANLQQVIWRRASLAVVGRARAVPRWLDRLPACVDEPGPRAAARTVERGVDPVYEECASA